MDVFSTGLLLPLALVVGALGLYLVLVSHAGESLPHWGGVVLIGVAVVGLFFLLTFETDGSDSSGTAFVFVLPALLAVAAGAATITCREARNAGVAFLLLALSTSALLIMSGAVMLALVSIVSCAGGLVFFVLQEPAADASSRTDESTAHEPFMACLAGALLGTVLVGAIVYSLPVDTSEIRAERDHATSPAIAEPSTELPVSAAAQILDRPVALGIVGLLVFAVTAGGTAVARRTGD